MHPSAADLQALRAALDRRRQALHRDPIKVSTNRRHRLASGQPYEPRSGAGLVLNNDSGKLVATIPAMHRHQIGRRSQTISEQTRSHRLRVMSGRDPDEQHRAATPLELLYDLTFVVAFGVASEQFAHLLAEGHYAAGLTGFILAVFAICWAWINFSWFASAYDTDDWAFRLATMVQMVGVIILALGLPQVFHSIDLGQPVDNSVTVAGYVVMRVAMIFLWLRAARQDPPRRRACQTYALTIGIAQLGWVLLLVLADSTVGEFFAWGALLMLVEMVGPVVAERGKGGTPWHAHLQNSARAPTSVASPESSSTTTTCVMIGGALDGPSPVRRRVRSRRLAGASVAASVEPVSIGSARGAGRNRACAVHLGERRRLGADPSGVSPAMTKP